MAVSMKGTKKSRKKVGGGIAVPPGGPIRLNRVRQIAQKMDLKRITSGRVVVIGCGGIGSWLITPLAVFLASFRKGIDLVLVDGDYFEDGNAYRMQIPAMGNKAEVWRGQFPNYSTKVLKVSAIPEYVTPLNSPKIIKDGDCVLLCVDNHATRKLVNSVCKRRQNVTLISAGNDGISEETQGTFGNVMLLMRRKGKIVAGQDFEKFHKEIAEPADKSPQDMNCIELAMSGEPQLTFTNLAAASGICSLIARLMMGEKDDLLPDEVLFDIFRCESKMVRYR